MSLEKKSDDESFEVYSDTSYSEGDEDNSNNKIENMNKIESEVWEVYKYLQKESDSSYNNILKNLQLKHVYELMYPNYSPLF